MAYRELELTLVSARELKNVNLITRMDVYAVVSISGDPLTRQCTPPDPSGGRNPCWNATLRFAVPPTAAEAAGSCLHVLLRAERVLGDRDIGEVVIPLAELLAGAPATGGPQQPQLASYQVRKLHRWEPRGVLNVSYRLGPVVAPVEPQPPKDKKMPAAVVMAYPAGVPSSQPPADAYPPPPPPQQQPRRTAAVHAAKHEAAPATPPTPPPRSGKSNGLGPAGPTQVCVGPHTQIFLGTPTTTSGPTTTASPTTGSNVSSWRSDGARPKHDRQHDDNAARTTPTPQSIISPRKEDHSRPKVFSQHDTQGAFFEEEVSATSHQAVVPPPFKREPTLSPHAATRRTSASTFSSSSSSFSSSPPPYSPAYPSTLSPCSSGHSFAPSPYSSARHPSTPSPRPYGQPKISDVSYTRATSHTNSPHSPFVEQASKSFGVGATSHTNSSSPTSNRRAAISSPLVANHSAMVPSQ